MYKILANESELGVLREIQVSFLSAGNRETGLNGGGVHTAVVSPAFTCSM